MLTSGEVLSPGPPRITFMTRISVLAFLTVVLAACSAPTGGDPGVRSTVPATASTTTTIASTTTAPTSTSDSASAPSLADRTRPVGSALLEETDSVEVPRPVGLTVPSLGIGGATVVDVGVEPNGEMEIPGAREVGWYRYGAVPGHDGSAVLAAHIAFNGIDGVFRRLDEVEVGETFSIEFDDGSERSFIVTETGQFEKAEIPFDRMFSRIGSPEVALVTCGGDFNRSLRSYTDNVIVFAVPLGG